MARRSEYCRAIFLLWCVSGIAFSIPVPSPMPRQVDEQRYTTRRTPKVFVEMPTPRTRLPLPIVNSELKTTTTVPSTTSTTHRSFITEEPLYRLDGSNGQACILLQVDALITVKYRTKLGDDKMDGVPPQWYQAMEKINTPEAEDGPNEGPKLTDLIKNFLISDLPKKKNFLRSTILRLALPCLIFCYFDKEADIYVPNDATVTGNCDNENTVTMSLKWNAFVLSWSFAKTPGGERWYVEKIELTYNSSEKHFEHVDQPNKTIRLSTGQKQVLFSTPVGKSYACSDETEIRLTDGKNQASVLLRDMKLQPFKFKNNEFAAEFSCTLLNARAGRDETAPVAVGSTLAAAVLLTITGYAAYRYFKVKKVKYDTME